MTPLADECLNPESVAAFLSGRLDPSEVRALERHVAGCSECRLLLSALARNYSTRLLTSRPRSDEQWTSEAGDHSFRSLQPFHVDTEPGVGTCVGRYVLLERLGAGAMGVVFAAYDPELDRRIAIKLLRSDPTLENELGPVRSLLLREAQAMARLAHPNVVAVYDVGEFCERTFIAMELIEGQTLALWLAGRRRPVREVLEAFMAAGRGLAAAHAVGLVHRDFKPENVLIGSDGRVRVTDFGLAHRDSAQPGTITAMEAGVLHRHSMSLNLTGLLAGTPFYMAPEQFAGQGVDARTDQFSFCVALYSALTGEHPLGPDPFQGLEGIVAAGRLGPRVRRDGRLRWVCSALERGLTISPADRYPSMDDLLACLGSNPRRRLLLLVVTALVMTAALAAALLAWRAHVAGVHCKGAELKLVGIWDEQRRKAIGHVFMASGIPRAGVRFVNLEDRLRRYTDDWVMMQTEACEEAHTAGDRQRLERRMGCLTARLFGLRELIDRLARGDANTLVEAGSETKELGDLSVCLDDEALLSHTRPDVRQRPAFAVAVDSGGFFSYFVRESDGTLWLNWHPDGTTGFWRRLKIDDNVAGEPVVLVDGNQRLSYFIRKSDGTLWHGWQQGRQRGDWQVTKLSSTVEGTPSVVLDRAKQLHYFIRKRDGTLWHGSGAGERWRESPIAVEVAGNPAALLDGSENLTYFIRRADGSLWRGRQDPADKARWHNENIDQEVAGDPVAALDVDDKLTFFVRMMDGTLRAFYQVESRSSLWGYVILTNHVAGNPTVAEDKDGKQHCWARTPDGALWHGWQSAPAQGPWKDEILSDGVASDPAAVVSGSDGAAAYLVRLRDGSLVYGAEHPPGTGRWRSTVLNSKVLPGSGVTVESDR
jgi:tRNA A-37 threonylcarbamoyl transferase component Bud32